jgi:nucleoside transporter
MFSLNTELLRGLLGLIAFPFIAWLLSNHKGTIMWKTVIFGLLIQLGLGVVVMLTAPGQAFFRSMNSVIIGLLEFSNEGARFLFGDLIDRKFAGAQFAFKVLPTIIFFSSLMSIAYYSGIMQKIVEFIAWIIMKLLGTSGAETLSISSNIFVGQTEAPLVIKPFIGDMTRSELSTVMTGGFATVAGGVMAAYVGMLSGIFPGIAGHLLTASIMSAPAAIVMSKLAFPEVDEPVTRGGVEIDVEEQNENLIDAAASGAKTGLRLAANVGAMLLAFISLVELANSLVGQGGRQLYVLVTDYQGTEAFLWGAIVGGIIAFFVLARYSWDRYRTKFWIGGLLTIFLVTALTYLVFAGTGVALLSTTGLGTLGLGLALSVIVMAVFNVTAIEKDFRLGNFFRSFGFLLLFSVLFGIFTMALGGTNNELGASFLTGSLVALIPAIMVFWPRPTRDGLIRGIVWFVTGTLALSMIIFTASRLVDGFNILSLLNRLTLELLFGYVFSGLAFLMGVPFSDIIHFGELIGHKIVVNEFVAFQQLQMMAQENILSGRSLVIASYALCGFANFSSIAIQIGGIGGLAPERQSELASLGVRTMICGALASFQTAAVAGVMQIIATQMGIDLVNLGGF